MKEYAYSPRLKRPGQMPDIDPLKPAMKVMLKIISKTYHAQTSGFVPPAGIRVSKTEIVAEDGSVFDTWIVERDDCAECAPGLVYIHGGAFYLPVSANNLALACVYAKEMNVRVYLPEYRLVPEHPAPCAFTDCLSLWQKLSEAGNTYGADPEHLLIMGESAGGALAAGVCLYLRDHAMNMPKGQLLIYPVTDNQTEKYPSAQVYDDAVWPLSANRHMWDAYLQDLSEEMRRYIVPMSHPDESDLPRAYVEPQEMDILCDEGKAYARRLQNAGVQTVLSCINGSYHGFDADLTSSLVQEVLQQRIGTGMDMLEQ